jgi:hypothetical protein
MISLNWAELAKGELVLVAGVTGGLLLGNVILRFSLPEKAVSLLVPPFCRKRLPAPVLFALGASLGSSRAGCAIVAEAYRDGSLTRGETLFGTLLQSFPGYIKRWIVSLSVAVGLAGSAGGIYATVVFLRSLCRFLLFLALLVRRERSSGPLRRQEGQRGTFSLAGTLARTLPAACFFYALGFALSPSLQAFLREQCIRLPLLPPSGWAVAGASFAHANAALGVAGGAMGAGTLSTAQAVLALLAGNMLAVLSRVLRQDIAFWIGIFPGEMVRSLFLWNLVTLVAFMAGTVALAAVPVLLGY